MTNQHASSVAQADFLSKERHVLPVTQVSFVPRTDAMPALLARQASNQTVHEVRVSAARLDMQVMAVSAHNVLVGVNRALTRASVICA